MATGTIQLLPQSAAFPDGSLIDNLGPALTRRQGSQATLKTHFYTLDFDGAGTNTVSCHFAFTAPQDYASLGTVRVHGMLNTTTSTVYVQFALSATTPGDADTPLEHAFSTLAGVEIGANATEARRLISGAAAANMDSAAPGDFVRVVILRSPANALDTSAAQFEMTGATLEYVTT